MAEETDQETVVPQTTTKTYISRKRLLIISGISLSLIIIVAIVIPTSIILTRKTDTTTTLFLATSESVAMVTSSEIITEMTKTTTFTLATTEVVTSTTTTKTTTLFTQPPGTETFQLTSESVFGIWGTTVGDDSFSSPPGNNKDKAIGTYWFAEPPVAGLDGRPHTHYTNYGTCLTNTVISIECGLNTGFYVTVAVKQFTLVAFRMSTYKQYIERDPLTITIEGSNYAGPVLTFGKSWTLIYNGTTGLIDDPGRSSSGMLTQVTSGVPIPFKSYRVLVTSKRGESHGVSYSDFIMIGYIKKV